VAVAFLPSGDAAVLDQRRGRIVVFGRTTGLPIRTIGSLGSGPGQLRAPSAMAVDGAGNLWVADAGNERIARFGGGGTYLGSLTGVGELRGIAVSPDGGRIYVSDKRNRITVYAPDGTALDEFGGRGNGLGKLEAPAQMTTDAAGNLWVADRGNNRVQEFGPDGQRLLAFGARGTGPGQLIHPTGVSVGCNGLLTVTDSDNNRVQQFALATPAVAPCVQLPAVGTPPPPKLPTLPAPAGPQVSVRVLRSSSVVRTRSLPLRVGCDTTCTLTGTATVTPAARPRKHHKPVVVTARTVKLEIKAGTSRVVRVGLSRAQAARLSRALHGRRSLTADVELTATADAGAPTTVSKRLRVTR
jgi:streptogramin lyase